MDQFIYVLKPARLDMVIGEPTEEEATKIEQHFEYLTKLSNEKIVLLAGRTLNNDEKTFGIVIFQCEKARAESIMLNDPAVTSGIMEAELFPYKIAIGM